MYKRLIKNFVMDLNIDSVKEYALKEDIVLTDDEASLLIDTAEKNIDDILDGNALYYIESLKEKINKDAYNKLLELFEKYKKFID